MTTRRRALIELRRILLAPGSAELTELFLALVTGAVGLWILHPQFISIPPAMSNTIPEPVSGIVATVIGCYSLWSQLLQIRVHQRRSSMSVAVLWLFIALTLGLPESVSISFPVYWVVTAFAAWVYLRRLDEDTHDD